MTEISSRSNQVPQSVGVAAEALLAAGGKAVELKWIFERSRVPMVMVDGRRRYLINRAARLTLRLSLDEMRTYAINDLTSSHLILVIEYARERLADTGSVVGCDQITGSNGRRLDIIYLGLSHVMPGLQLIAFAPADSPEGDSGETERDHPDRRASLTPREIEMLALAADGLSGPELAQRLVLSPYTIHSHFKHIYEKLGVQNRAAAVAKAMRIGVID